MPAKCVQAVVKPIQTAAKRLVAYARPATARTQRRPQVTAAKRKLDLVLPSVPSVAPAMYRAVALSFTAPAASVSMPAAFVQVLAPATPTVKKVLVVRRAIVTSLRPRQRQDTVATHRQPRLAQRSACSVSTAAPKTAVPRLTATTISVSVCHLQVYVPPSVPAMQNVQPLSVVPKPNVRATFALARPRTHFFSATEHTHHADLSPICSPPQSASSTTKANRGFDRGTITPHTVKPSLFHKKGLTLSLILC